MSQILYTDTRRDSCINNGATEDWIDLPGGIQGYRRLSVYAGGTIFYLRDASKDSKTKAVTEYSGMSQFDEMHYFEPGCKLQVYLPAATRATIEISRLKFYDIRISDKGIEQVIERIMGF